jgi:hypothetical protein
MIVAFVAAVCALASASGAATFAPGPALLGAARATAQETPLVAGDDSVVREWRARALALDVDGTREQWLAAAASANWDERWHALDALLRAARAGLLADDVSRVASAGGDSTAAVVRELALRALHDARPNLAAHGAALLVELGASDAADEEALVRLATLPLAEARAAAAQLLGARRGTFGNELLGRLVRDADATVRDAAGRALLARQVRGEGAPLHLADLLARAYANGGDGEVATWLVALEGVPPHVFDALIEACVGRAAPHERVGELLEVARAAEGEPLAPVRLADLWCASQDWAPARDALFTRAAKRGGASVALELVRVADLWAWVFEEETPGPDTRRGGERESLLARLRDVGGDVTKYPFASIVMRAAHGAAGTRVALAALLRSGDATFLRGLEVLGSELVGWTPELVNAAYERAEAMGAQELVLGALESAARAGDEQAIAALAAQLAACTHDEPRARTLFKALARLPDPTEALEALDAHWLAADDETALALVPLLPRVQRPVDVRRRLVELGQRHTERRGSIARVLSAWRGDDEVGWYLERWSVEYLAELEPLDAGERRRASDRAAELLPALADVAGDGAVEGLVEVFDWSIGREPSIGRVAARQLALTRAGRDALWSYAEQHLDRDLRLELGLALADARAEPLERAGREELLVGLLAPRGSRLGIDDGERQVAALARIDHPRAHAALLELARGDAAGNGAGDVLALLALEALGRTNVATSELVRVLRDERTFERRRAALRALVERGASAEIAAFEADWLALSRVATRVDAGWADADWPRRELALDFALPGHPDELPLLAEELSSALVRLDAAPADWRERLFDDAFASAREDLLVRFARGSRPAVEFRRSEELALFVFDVSRGSGARMLAALPRHFELDGRFLLELARRAAATDDRTAEPLVRAAVVALLGEGASAGSELLRARALAESVAFRLEHWHESAHHARALADPFVDRPLGRGDSAARPVPGSDRDARREYVRREHWSLALAAAERGDRNAARERLASAAALVFAAGNDDATDDAGAAARHREVEARVQEILRESR